MQKPHVTVSQDGALNLEWILKNHRAAIHIEPEPKDSSWNIVAPNHQECGLLSDIDIVAFVKALQEDTVDGHI